MHTDDKEKGAAVPKASPTSIYVLGMAGTGTGALAGLLQSAGYAVRGSDSHAYPPMSDKLREWGIALHVGFCVAHLTPQPDLVVVGNVIRSDNVEATYVREHRWPTMSMPQAIAELAIGQRHSIVVAGTHGKTTTTALIAHLLQAAGQQPGFLVGGALIGQRDSFCLGQGPFVIEGDEYDSAYFDKGAKFLHYRAQTLVVTSLEYDHADIYPNVEAIESAFAKLMAQMKPGGTVIIWQGAHRAVRLARTHAAHLRVILYDATLTDAPPGETAKKSDERAWRLVGEDVAIGPAGTRLHARWQAPLADGEPLTPRPAAATDVAIEVPLWGEFGAQNTLAALAVAQCHGVDAATLRRGLRSFAGVRRRLEERGGHDDRLFVDDFAHHPTAVAATLQAARARYPHRRLWAIFEPRSATSRRNVFFNEYKNAFALADVSVIATHARLAEVDAAERFAPSALATALRAQGHTSFAPADQAELLRVVATHSRANDVVLVLSNGDFEGLVPKLLALRFAQQGA